MGSLLHKRMLEQVGSLRRRSSLKNQLGTDELRECRLKVLFWKSGYGCNQSVRELSTNCSSDLRHVMYRRQAIKAGRQGGVQCRRYRKWWNRSLQLVRIASFLQQTAFEDGLR